VARAQQPRKLPTIGFLGANNASFELASTDAFVQRLRELGWIENQTVAIEYRFPSDGRAVIPACGGSHLQSGSQVPRRSARMSVPQTDATSSGTGVRVHEGAALSERQRMNLWPLLACAGIIALVAIVFVQQSWVKHRAIEAAHERATEQVQSEK
jgi:hypothetical protein